MSSTLRPDWAGTARAVVAVHEAAHAVVMIRHGFGIRYVTLRARSGGGQVVPAGRMLGPGNTRTVMTVYAAGAVAEDLAGIEPRKGIACAASIDLRALRRLARWAARDAGDVDSVRAQAAAAWADACDLVTEHYGAVLAVAEALVTSRRALTGDQIAGIAADAMPASPPPVPDARDFWAVRYSRLQWTVGRPAHGKGQR